MRRYAGLLAERNFRLLWLGETISQTGTAVTSVAMPLIAVTTLNASTFVVGLLSVAVWLPWVLVGLAAGAWVDRVDRKPLMVAADGVSIALLASVPLAEWLGVLSIPFLLVVVFGIGVTSVFFLTAQQVLIPSVVERNDLPEANAKILGSEAAARIAGPGIGGVLTQAAGAFTGILVNAAGFAVSLGCLVALKVEEPARPAVRRSLFHEIGDGIRYIATDPYLRPVTTFAAAVNLASSAIQALQVVFLVRVVGAGPVTVGVMLAITAGGALAGAMAIRRVTVWLGTGRGMVVTAFTTVPFVLLIPLTTDGLGLVWFAVGMFMLDAGITGTNVIIGSFRHAYCPREMLGRVVASMRTLAYSALPLGALLGAVLGTVLDIRGAMWLAAVVLTLSALFLLPLRQTRDLPVNDV
ncbi:MFS transporter [Actinocrispum sp. NPDC049592]|uniref:MFS transporter n=1 Tax=Actinocrispum sp. NPDC049592 TaxID=3154835 RepID=UPI003432A720